MKPSRTNWACIILRLAGLLKRQGAACIALQDLTPNCTTGVAHPPQVATAPQPVAQQRVKFGQYDARGKSERALYAAAAFSSSNGPTLVVLTEDRNVWAVAHRVAENRAKEGHPTSLVLGGGNKNELAFWVVGQETSIIKNPGAADMSTLARDIRNALDSAHDYGRHFYKDKQQQQVSDLFQKQP